jgi:uncharacterized protein (TIRG00374 family)
MAEAVLALKNIYSKNRNLFLFTIKILTAAGLLIFISYTLNPAKIISGFKEAEKTLILFALGLSILNIYLQFLKWKLVCKTLLNERSSKKIFLSLFYGFSLGSFTPARVGEFFGRAIAFTEDQSLLKITSSVLIDKFFSLIIVLIIGSVSFLFYLKQSISVTILFSIIIISLFFIILIKSNYLFLKKIIPLSFRKLKTISSFYSEISFFFQTDNKFRIKMLLLSFLFYSCFVLQFALLVGAFANHFYLVKYLEAGNLVMFAKTLFPPISIGELGIREGVSAFFVKSIGENAVTGFNASIFLFLMNILLPGITGLFLLIKRK